MKLRIQAVLFFIYRCAVRCGLTSVPLLNRAILKGYFFYKRHYEMPFINNLYGLLRRDASVIDVGASLGFFTFDIERHLPGLGRVYAIEPEKSNFDYLVGQVRKNRLENRVVLTNAAIADKCGRKKLKVDWGHPGNHRLSESEGVDVELLTLDGLMESAGWPRISLVKIDVQGAELLVLQGATELLDRFKPALIIEVDDRMLPEFGSSSRQLLSMLAAMNYRIFRADDPGYHAPMTVNDAISFSSSDGYCDLVFIHSDMTPGSVEN
jgi:FkbM family methyltransferase